MPSNYLILFGWDLGSISSFELQNHCRWWLQWHLMTLLGRKVMTNLDSILKSRGSFLKIFQIVLSSGWTNGDFLVVQSKLISWWEFLFLNFSHFYFCKPSVLIISCICSHPSTLSFSNEVQLIHITLFALGYNSMIQYFHGYIPLKVTAKSWLYFSLLHVVFYYFS